MAYEDNLHKNGVLVAAADLSTHQFKLVKMTSTGVNICTAATDVPIGVLQNKPASGEACDIADLGITKVVAGGALATIGTVLTSDSTGRVAAASTGNRAILIQLEAATAAGQLIAAKFAMVATAP